MESFEKNWVRLPLKTATNVRELGGYPAMEGKQTAYHRFLRTDDISRLTVEEMEFLYAYGVRLDIDLRGQEEVNRAADSLIGYQDIVYKHIPFFGRNAADARQAPADDIREMSDLYLVMLNNRKIVKELFETIAEASSGVILFHCSAGKDRTGVLAMLLMSLAGVDKEDCITNYMQSFTNLLRKDDFVAMNQEMEKNGMIRFAYSLPETIERAYNYVMTQFGSTEKYLLSCNLSQQTIETVRKRVLD